MLNSPIDVMFILSILQGERLKGLPINLIRELEDTVAAKSDVLCIATEGKSHSILFVFEK